MSSTDQAAESDGGGAGGGDEFGEHRRATGAVRDGDAQPPLPDARPPTADAPHAAAPPAPAHASGGAPSTDGDYSVYNNFYGPQYHGRTHYGIATAAERTGRARVTGLLESDEIDALLRAYVRPDGFDDAAEELSRTGVVVLTGPQGSGKRAGAVRLLRETVGPSADYVVLSPDIGLDQLAERVFDAGVGYVILDRTGTVEDDVESAADFAWRRVRDQLRRHEAHLVITAVHGVAGRPPEAVRHLAWQPPVPAKVMRARLALTGTPEDTVARAVAAIPPRCPVAAVVEAARRIASGTDPDQAWKELNGGARQAAKDWFDVDGGRSLREVAEVTTLAFAPGIGRRAFESLQDVLERLLEPVYAEPGEATAPTEGAPDTTGSAAAPDPRHRRTGPAGRRRSLSRNALVATETETYGATTREVLVFADDGLRRWVLQALWRDHPTEWWDAVRTWLDAIVDDGPDPDLEHGIASGIALLGHVAFDEVVQSYLAPWARGESGGAGQDLAAFVLWYMCLEERQAAAALTLARTWAQSPHPGPRRTALLAFSGELGVTFPTDAVKWLWALHRGGEFEGQRDRDRGYQAWAGLFLTLVESREDAGIVLDALVHRLRRERRVRAAAYSDAGRLVLGTALRVFVVGERSTGRPAVARHLVDRPQDSSTVAELWAAALCYRPLRRTALNALIAAVRALPAMTPQSTKAAGKLGSALAEALPPAEHPLLLAELSRAATARPARASDPDCVATLLGALNRVKESHPR